MNVRYYNGHWHLDHDLFNALRTGAREFDIDVSESPLDEYTFPDADVDVAIIVGVAGNSRRCFQDHIAVGKRVIYVDKGYIRYREQVGCEKLPTYVRMSVNAFQPTRYFQRVQRPDDRLSVFNMNLRPLRTNGMTVVYAGKSQKFYNWFNMGDVHDVSVQHVKMIRAHTDREIIYRAKKTTRQLDVLGVSFPNLEEKKRIYSELGCAWALVTWGSNAALDAIIYGVPVISLGECISAPVSSRTLYDIESPYFPSDQDRWQWLCDLTYCQFTFDEIRSGFAWDTIIPELRQ